MTDTRKGLAFSSLGLLLCCFVHFAFKAKGALPEPQKGLALSVDVERKGRSNVVLRLRLTNVGDNVVKIPLGFLPWNRYAMRMVLVEADDHFSTPLRQEFVIADPPPGEPHQIKSGQSLEGTIELNRRFPDLSSKLKSGDVLLFWTYQCPAEGIRVERLGGWILLPQFKP